MKNRPVLVTATDWLSLTIKLTALAALVLFTNFGFADRLQLLLANNRWFTLVFYVAIWGISVGALVIAALQPARIARLIWAFVLSASAAAAFFYTSVSGSNLSVFDALSLWVARHEAGRAFDQYLGSAFWSAVVFACSFFIISAPIFPTQRLAQKGLRLLSWAPAVPVLLIAAIIMIKQGGGSQAMPCQFQPLAVSLVAAGKEITHRSQPRGKVQMAPQSRRPVKHIVMLVDESVRPDYLNWKEGNRVTPFMAANKHRFANFGNAVSAGNCSSYSNALLRFGASPANLVKSVNTNPTIWQYAKKAGFRTVYIDGQSGFMRDPGKLQNFMTVGETKFIDRIVRMNGTPMPQLDREVLKVINAELKSSQPVFIFANKNGAHFPYDEGYPESETVFSPTVSMVATTTDQARINSYRNVLRWSVDGFFAQMFETTDLSDTAIIYTSDHGQALGRGQLTHCSVSNPDPREGLVPMLAISGNDVLMQRFREGAELNRNRISHFAVFPSVLEMMGYPVADVTARYTHSLFNEYRGPLSFTSGDIFGVFSNRVNWTEVDLGRDYREAPLGQLMSAR